MSSSQIGEKGLQYLSIRGKSEEVETLGLELPPATTDTFWRKSKRNWEDYKVRMSCLGRLVKGKWLGAWIVADMRYCLAVQSSKGWTEWNTGLGWSWMLETDLNLLFPSAKRSTSLFLSRGPFDSLKKQNKTLKALQPAVVQYCN